MKPYRSFRLADGWLLLSLLFTMALVLPACGGGDSSPDGDVEIVDSNCPPCYIWFRGECVEDPKCSDGDSTGDEDQIEDGDQIIDGDKDDPDGDQVDGDGIIWPDEDFETVDGDQIVTDGDDELDVIEAEEWPDREDIGDCQEDRDCPDNRYFCNLDTHLCELKPIDGDWDVEGDIPMCDNNYRACETHDVCRSGVLCNPDTGCCDPLYRPTCTYRTDCPDGWFCTPDHYCDIQCWSHEMCEDEFGIQFCCRADGVCVLDDICDAIDGDEDVSPCQSCQDCVAIYGDHSHFCNVNLQECMPIPDDKGCCESADCPQYGAGYANALCDQHVGLCIPQGDEDPVGLIGGYIYASNALDDLGDEDIRFMVELEDSTGQLLDQRTNLIMVKVSADLYAVSYQFVDLPLQKNYYLYLTMVPPPIPYLDHQRYPLNPVYLGTGAAAQANDVDFYMDLDDPRLAVISGDIYLEPDYQDGEVSLRVWGENEDGTGFERLPEYHYMSDIGDLVEGVRSYSIRKLTNGSYYVSAYVTDSTASAGELGDYISTPIVVENLSQNPSQQFTGVDFHFGSQDSELASVSGSVFTASYMDADLLEVWLYDNSELSYPVAGAWLASGSRSNEILYTFPNVEFGTYYLQGQYAVDLPENVSAPIPTAQPDDFVLLIDSAQEYDGIDLTFDTTRSGYGSISGELLYDSSYSGYTFSVEVYRGEILPVLLEREDLILDQDDMAGQGSYFVESLLLDTSYYLQLIGYDGFGGREILAEQGPYLVGGSAQENLTGVDFDLRP